MLPLVTVVIPTYNRVEFVQQAISSVRSQTYKRWELIVVDDGSDDGTAESVVALADSRIKLLTSQHIGNIAFLRNRGVKAGSGDWLAFLDSDDIWTDGRLEIHLEKLMEGGKRWGYGGFEMMDNKMQPISNKAGIYQPISGWIIKEVLTTEASANIGTLLIERRLFEESGGFDEDAELLYREDYELVIRLALRSEALAVPDLLVRVREHSGRSTKAFEYGHDRTAAVYERFIQKHPDKELSKIARRRMAGELTEAAVKRIRQKKYFEAIRRLGRGFTNGDSWRHLLSAIRRGFSGNAD